MLQATIEKRLQKIEAKRQGGTDVAVAEVTAKKKVVTAVTKAPVKKTRRLAQAGPADNFIISLVLGLFGYAVFRRRSIV